MSLHFIVIDNQQAALRRTHESFLATSLNGFLATTTQASSLMTSTYKGCFRLTKWTFRSVPVCQHVNRHENIKSWEYRWRAMLLRKASESACNCIICNALRNSDQVSSH